MNDDDKPSFRTVLLLLVLYNRYVPVSHIHPGTGRERS